MPTTTKDEAARTPGQVARDSFPERRGDWMQTYSGRRFWPLDPRAEDVAIEDIAHALSLQTRFGGHCLRFYSVAEHCVHLARSASKEAALWLLLHDGSEAYLSDMVRPLKRHMPEYRAAEDRVAWAVYEAFDLDPGMEPAEVKERDCRILIDERAQVMLATGEAWNYGGATEPLGVTLQFWTPEQAEREFLATYSAITGQSVAMPTSPAPASPGVPDSLRALSEGLQHSFMVTRSDHARERYRIEITCPGLVSMQDMHSALVAVQSGRPFVSADAQWREALAPFVAHYQSWMDEWPGDTECTVYARPITFGDLRRARALLSTHPAGQSAGSGAAWIVTNGEMGDDLRFRMWSGRTWVWTSSLSQAAHFAREGDAKQILPDGDEHGERVEPAPDSTRTGQGEATEDNSSEVRTIAELLRRHDGTTRIRSRHYDTARAIAAALAARPAAPEAQGAWLPISTAPKDGTEIWAWLYGSGVRKLRWWSAEEICEEEGRNTPEAYQAGFYEVADRTEWWNPAWWLPVDHLPAPPASSGQEG